jgi:hypothetical protein
VSQLVERPSARIAQHQVETAKAVGANVLDAFAPAKPVQRHAGIEIIEDAKCFGRQHQLGGRQRIRTIRGHHGDIGPGHRAHRLRQYTRPIGIQHQAAAGKLGEVALRRIEGQVALEERHAMTLAAQCGAQAAPERGVPVAPRRTHRQTEDRDVHSGLRLHSVSDSKTPVSLMRCT